MLIGGVDFLTQICVIQESEESTFGENFTAKRAVPALFLSTWIETYLCFDVNRRLGTT